MVKYTIECVAILLEEKTDWDHIKKNVLSDAGLLGKLKNLKGENITPKTKALIKAKRILYNFSRWESFVHSARDEGH